MAVIVQGRAINLPTGARQLTAENVPDNLTLLRFTLKRATTATLAFWPNASTLLNLAAWISIDGGPFRECARVTGAPGGILTEQGVEQPCVAEVDLRALDESLAEVGVVGLEPAYDEGVLEDRQVVRGRGLGAIHDGVRKQYFELYHGATAPTVVDEE